MAINSEVTNSSIVKTIAASPMFKFNDATDGATNKIAVQNRVKKMSQAERKELMIELDHVIGKVNGVANVPSLKERGLCTLLLSDDGKVQSKSFFIVSFVCGFLNLIHARTSSAAVIKKLEDTKSVLDTKAIVLPAPNVKVELETGIARLQQKIEAQDPAKQNIRDLIEVIKEIRTEALDNLCNADWEEIDSFVGFEQYLEALNQKAGLGDETKRIINDAVKDIKRLINTPSHLQGSLNQIKWGVISSISIRLRNLEVGLEDHISSIQDKKEKLQKSKELVQRRLSEFEKSNREASARKLFGESQARFHDAAKQIRILDGICKAIETLTKSNGSFSALATAIQSINLRLQSSSDDKKNVQNFAEKFALLAQFVAKDATLNKQGLADVIDLSVLTNSSYAELQNRLAAFKTNPNLNFPTTDDQMKELINDYVAYWNVLFTGVREAQKQILETEKDKIAPKAPEPVQPQVVPQPIAPVAASVPAVALPPRITIPTSGHATLIAIATGLQNAREDNTADFGWYIQVNPSSNISNDIAEKVYGRFYEIMHRRGHLGSVKADGHSSDPAWGTNVFTTGLSNGVPPAGVPRALLNHYRVQAIVDVING